MTSHRSDLRLQCALAAGNQFAAVALQRRDAGTMATGTTRTMRWNDLIGRQVGQDTSREEIRLGGSSRVYRSRDAEMQRDVAVKVIANDGDDRVGFVKRFQREVQAVAQLNHPNIVTVFDRGEDDDVVYLVMQCVLGGTFRQK